MILTFIISIIKILKRKVSFINLLLIFWIPLEFYFSNLSGRLYNHYFMMWVPIIIISLLTLMEYFEIEKLNFEKKIVIVSLIFLSFLGKDVFYKQILKNFHLISHNYKLGIKRSSQISKEINKNYKKEKTILVWGNQPSIYFLTNKKTPIKYFYNTTLILNSLTSKNMMIDFVNQFKKNPPDLIIETDKACSLSLDDINLYSEANDFFYDFKVYVSKNYLYKKNSTGAIFYQKNKII